MDKFWQWMKYKDYDIYGIAVVVTGKQYEKTYVPIPRQMLIGYMFEYLIERYKDLDDVNLCIGENIEEFYNGLKENIEELDK